MFKLLNNLVGVGVSGVPTWFNAFLFSGVDWNSYDSLLDGLGVSITNDRAGVGFDERALDLDLDEWSGPRRDGLGVGEMTFRDLFNVENAGVASWSRTEVGLFVEGYNGEDDRDGWGVGSITLRDFLSVSKEDASFRDTIGVHKSLARLFRSFRARFFWARDTIGVQMTIPLVLHSGSI